MNPETPFTRYLHGAHPDHPATDPYLASENLAAAVNAALAIGRPLLVSGEPGTGKTSMAYSIARQLGLGEVLRFDTHSDSRWQDCLYRFDALARLYAAQSDDDRAKDAKEFRHLAALGQAIKSEKQRVVLIDEVDKASRDFPNGLLAAIEGNLQFHIAETGETLSFQGASSNKPILVFTTNEERALPDAFLRRCIFHHIESPGREQLRKIVLLRLEPREDAEAFKKLVGVAEKAVTQFVTLRKNYKGKLEKQPATAELLDWVQVLIHAGVAVDKIGVGKPHTETLLKTKRDLEAVLKSP